VKRINESVRKNPKKKSQKYRKDVTLPLKAHTFTDDPPPNFHAKKKPTFPYTFISFSFFYFPQ